jgi:hypothetical protein
MDISTSQSAVKLPDSQLLIHTDDPSTVGTSRLEPVLRRLRSLYTQVLPSSPPLPIKILIFDLQGHCVFSTEWAGPLVTVALPGGAYHIKVLVGEMRKSYTLTIESGVATDLDLRWTSRVH